MGNRYEFHSQEANSDEGGERRALRSNIIQSVSFFYGFAVIIVLLGLYGIAYAVYEVLPTPLKISDEVKSMMLACTYLINVTIYFGLGCLSGCFYSRTSST